eukprot:6175387-Pleurochrysis_carterae.AAC.4
MHSYTDSSSYLPWRVIVLHMFAGQCAWAMPRSALPLLITDPSKSVLLPCRSPLLAVSAPSAPVVSCTHRVSTSRVRKHPPSLLTRRAKRMPSTAPTTFKPPSCLLITLPSLSVTVPTARLAYRAGSPQAQILRQGNETCAKTRE